MYKLFCHGLGFPKSSSEHLSRPMACRTTSVFHWEFLSSAYEPGELLSEAADPAAYTLFSWKPPDLKEGGKWFLTRIANLREACTSCPDPSGAFDDGISRLNRHSMNYDSIGPNPQWLQLLWWEKPPKHWEDLRVGCKQHFMINPSATLQPNAKMDESGLAPVLWPTELPRFFIKNFYRRFTSLQDYQAKQRILLPITLFPGSSWSKGR